MTWTDRTSDELDDLSADAVRLYRRGSVSRRELHDLCAKHGIPPSYWRTIEQTWREAGRMRTRSSQAT